MNLKTFKVGLIDRYIMKKFLSTYFGAIGMLVIVFVIFDMTEKLDDLMELGAKMEDIIFVYYANSVPFFINQFSALVTFIAAIFFTSKMAYDTEIIAILSSGVNFKRLLYPYFLSAFFIATLSLILGLYVIPITNNTKIEFEAKYTKKGGRNNYEEQIYRQLDEKTFFSLKGYSNKSKSAELLVVESYEDSKISRSLMARNVTFNTETLHWTAPKYIIRTYENGKEHLQKLEKLDTMINLTANEIGKVVEYSKTLNIDELNTFIKEQKAKGSDMVPKFEVERQNRYAYPFSTFILTFIAVSLSSRKVRGGTGVHMATGITLCFSYILFMQFANEFAKGGVISPIIAVWLPNILFTFIAIFLYHKAPK